ncbi:MAG TPA: hypothetical protein VFL42_06860 [Terriglobales bacterium]|nr:hypothetical protein [Terriglobales bacterium]
MALDAGDSNASSGMSQTIYDAMNTAMKDGIPPDQLPDVQKGWKKLAASIAQGVVNHLKANLEVTVSGVQASGTFNAQNITTAQTGSVTGQVK